MHLQKLAWLKTLIAANNRFSDIIDIEQLNDNPNLTFYI